jgi:hypothetical protein
LGGENCEECPRPDDDEEEEWRDFMQMRRKEIASERTIYTDNELKD